MSQVGDVADVTKTFEIERLSSSSSARREAICIVCEKGKSAAGELGELVACTGSCQHSFHRSCTSGAHTDHFKCNACLTGMCYYNINT